MTRPLWLAMGALASLLAVVWFNRLANRNARKPFAPAVSSADYISIFLWIVAAVLGITAAVVRGK